MHIGAAQAIWALVGDPNRHPDWWPEVLEVECADLSEAAATAAWSRARSVRGARVDDRAARRLPRGVDLLRGDRGDHPVRAWPRPRAARSSRATSRSSRTASARRSSQPSQGAATCRSWLEQSLANLRSSGGAAAGSVVAAAAKRISAGALGAGRATARAARCRPPSSPRCGSRRPRRPARRCGREGGRAPRGCAPRARCGRERSPVDEAAAHQPERVEALLHRVLRQDQRGRAWVARSTPSRRSSTQASRSRRRSSAAARS